MLARKVTFSQKGSLSNLKLVNEPRPVRQGGELLIRIRASAINPSDVKNVMGAFAQTTLPRVPGRDFCGVVEEGPADLVGKVVYGTGGNRGYEVDGSHADYMIAKPGTFVIKPSIFTDVQAASVGVGFVTASLMIKATQLNAGETVVVLGAKGAVGSACSQIAAWKGAKVIGAAQGPKDKLPVTDKIISHWLSMDDMEAAKQELLTITNGRGAQVVLDTVGEVNKGLALLGNQGRQAEISLVPGNKDTKVTFDLLDFYRRELTLKGVNTMYTSAEEATALLQSLAPGFEAGALTAPSRITTFPVEQFAAAYESVSKPGGGKAVLTFV